MSKTAPKKAAPKKAAPKKDSPNAEAAAEKRAVNEIAEENAKFGGEGIELTFLSDADAKKAAKRMRDTDEEWAADMTHEESLADPRAINRSM